MLCVVPAGIRDDHIADREVATDEGEFAPSADHAGSRATPGGAWMTRRVFVPNVTTTMSA